MTLYKPNQKPTKGEYEERGPRGGKVPNARHVTIDKKPVNEKLPPTQKPGNTWVKV